MCEGKKVVEVVTVGLLHKVDCAALEPVVGGEHRVGAPAARTGALLARFLRVSQGGFS